MQSWDFQDLFLDYSQYDVESPLEITFPSHICGSPSQIKTVIAGRVLHENFEAIAFDSNQNEVFHILLETQQRKLFFWSVKEGKMLPEDGKLELETDIDVEEQFVIRMKI